jgi:hypothetical protein
VNSRPVAEAVIRQQDPRMTTDEFLDEHLSVSGRRSARLQRRDSYRRRELVFESQPVYSTAGNDHRRKLRALARVSSISGSALQDVLFSTPSNFLATMEVVLRSV